MAITTKELVEAYCLVEPITIEKIMMSFRACCVCEIEPGLIRLKAMKEKEREWCESVISDNRGYLHV